MARKDITMSEEEIQAFLVEQTTAQVATNGHDGFPHVAPMWFVVDEGRVAFRSFTKSQKMTNLGRDNRLTVLIETGHAYSELKGLMIKGEAELIEDRDVVLGLYGALAARYPMVGDEPVAMTPDELESAFGRFAEKNTAVIVNPTKIISWDHTKLDGAY